MEARPTPVTLNRPDSRWPTTTRTAADASSTPATPALIATAELVAHRAGARLERVAEARGVLAPAGRAVGRAAAAPADDRCERLHQVPRMHALDEGLAHRDREPGAPRVGGPGHGDAGPE